MRTRRGVVTGLAMAMVTAVPLLAAGEGRYEAAWESLDKRPCPQWFLDAKFGIFIHWGVYSVPAWGKVGEYAEWYWNKMADKKPDNVWWQFHAKNYGENFDYKDFAPQFRAELFDADQWADIFARSGAKYIVPTSKHHEGFCLWPSAEASKTWGRPWNAVEIGPKRDLMGELADGHAQARAEVRLLLLALRVVQPALADRPQAVRRRAHDPAVQGRGHPLPAGDHLQRRRVGPAVEGLEERGAAGVAVQRIAVQGRGRHQRPLGQGLPAQARRLLDHRIRRRPEGRLAIRGKRAAAWPISYGYNRAERIDDYKTGREFILVADRPGQPRRQPAAGHRPRRRRHDPADHGAAPAGDRRLAQGQRRGHLRHALRRPLLPVDARASGPSRSSASTWSSTT